MKLTVIVGGVCEANEAHSQPCHRGTRGAGWHCRAHTQKSGRRPGDPLPGEMFGLTRCGVEGISSVQQTHQLPNPNRTAPPCLGPLSPAQPIQLRIHPTHQPIHPLLARLVGHLTWSRMIAFQHLSRLCASPLSRPRVAWRQEVDPAQLPLVR